MNKGNNSVKQVTEETDTSDNEMTDIEDHSLKSKKS